MEEVPTTVLLLLLLDLLTHIHINVESPEVVRVCVRNGSEVVLSLVVIST